MKEFIIKSIVITICAYILMPNIPKEITINHKIPHSIDLNHKTPYSIEFNHKTPYPVHIRHETDTYGIKMRHQSVNQ